MQVSSISILAPTLSGGGLTRAYFLAEMIQALKIDVEIIGPLQSDHDIYPLVPAGISVVPIKCSGNREYTAPMLQRLQGDILYAIKPRPSSFGVGLYARQKLSRPLLLDIDDWERSYRPKYSADSIKLLFTEKLIRFANAVTVNNTALQNRFGGTLLPSGKNENRYNPSLYNADEYRSRLGFGDRFVIMFPGTAVPHSGLEDLLTAMDMLGRDDLLLVVVGGRGSGRRYIDRHLSRWSHCIEILSEVSAERLPSIIAAAHVVTAPHRDWVTARYNFPIKLIDGLAMGKPILATKVGDIPAFLEGTGYLAKPGSPEDLARALQEILSDTNEMQRRGEAGRQRFDQRFSLRALGGTFSRIIQEL